MLFSIVANEGCTCAGCGPSEYEGLSIVVTRKDGKRDLVTVCAGCLFQAAIGEKAFNKALGKTDPPSPVPVPASITPRFFG